MELRKNSIVLLTVGLLLIGCNSTAQPEFDPKQPEFDPNIRTVVSMGGMMYPIPYKSDYSNTPMPSRVVKWAQKNNVDCSEGDIGWTSPGTREKVEGKGPSALLTAYRNGQMGCVSPLTKVEEKRYKAFVAEQQKIREKKLASLKEKIKQSELRIAKLEKEEAERKAAYIAQKAKLKNAYKDARSNSSSSYSSKSYSSSSYSSSNSYSSSSKRKYSMKEGLAALNRQLKQINSNMAKRSYYYPSSSYSSPSYGQSSSSSYSGYRGSSGARYQYDSSRYEDRIRYQYDYNAQYRDRTYRDYSGYRYQDRSSGQYGMGIYR